MWWFLVITVGSSIVPVYVAPMGPFPTEAVCQSIQSEMNQRAHEQGRTIRATTCWRDR